MINFSQISFLDCTLRDGGQLFESLHYETKVVPNNEPFFVSPVRITNLLFNVGVDIVEIGVINEDGLSNNGVSVYDSLPDNLFSSVTKTKNQQLAILFKGPNFDLELIPAQNKIITVVRVVIRYSEISESLLFCKKLNEKKYNVSIQLMLTPRFKIEEIIGVIEFANENDIYAVYIVDSYGYMEYKELDFYFSTFDIKLKKTIRIGLHLHNNNGLALSNITRIISEKDTSRNIIIDSSLLGLGLGAGNLKTEELLLWFRNDKRFSYDDLMYVAEEIEKYSHINAWGSSLVQLISAHFRLSYKYSEYMRYERNLNYITIFKILNKIQGERRHLFNREYCDSLMQEYENV